MADEFILAEKKLFTSIADCIRESKNTTETFNIASLGEKVKETWGGARIKGTCGTFTVATNCNNYILTHGLGEVPLFFMIGLGASPYNQTDASLPKLVGAWGFSDRPLSIRASQVGTDSPACVVRATSIEDAYKASLNDVTENTICIADENGTIKLVAGAPYYWVALSEESFS